MTNPKNTLHYRSYLLRFWEEPGRRAEESVWRFSLEDPRTSRRYGFASFEALITALRVELSEAKEVESDEGGENCRNLYSQ